MSKIDIEINCPRLINVGYLITSPPTKTYNCFAWAAGRTDRWWEPDLQNQYYWPPEAPRELTKDALSKAFESLGYFPCENENYEEEFEKIAIFFKEEEPTHAARQLDSGKWTSKLGEFEDIEHPTLEALSGYYYGYDIVILRRLHRNFLTFLIYFLSI